MHERRLREGRPTSSLSGLGQPSRIPKLARSISLRVRRASEARALYNTGLLSPADTSHEQSRSGRLEAKRSAVFAHSNIGDHYGMHPVELHTDMKLCKERCVHLKNNTNSASTTSSDRRKSSHEQKGYELHSNTSQHSAKTKISRSTSFGSSHGVARTFETARKFSYVSPYSKKAIAAEKKLQTAKNELTRQSSQQLPSDQADNSYDFNDSDSMKSFSSVNSAVSCDTAMISRGTPACGSRGSWHGKNLKYAIHCGQGHGAEPGAYLTPTQRAAHKIRELKAELKTAYMEIASKDNEIVQLTRQLVTLRLQTAQVVDGKDGNRNICRSKEEITSHSPKFVSTPPSAGSDYELHNLSSNLAVSTSQNLGAPSNVSPTAVSLSDTADSTEFNRSLADSGHCDDCASPCLSGRESFEGGPHVPFQRVVEEIEEEEGSGVIKMRDGNSAWAPVGEVTSRMHSEVERQMVEAQRKQQNEKQALKAKHNERVEALLTKLSDANLRYFELRPLYDISQEKVRELENHVRQLKEELLEAESRHQKMYLQMFLKGQQAARLEVEDEVEFSSLRRTQSRDDYLKMNSSNDTVLSLMKQLAHTEEELEKVKGLYQREVAQHSKNSVGSKQYGELDPEITLQFLKSAVYYFLTDRDNSHGHLRAIESILGYTVKEKRNIQKAVRF